MPSPSGSRARTKRAGRAPFTSSHEHLLAELDRVDRLVRAQVLRARAAVPHDDLRGLSISEEDVDALLRRSIGEPHWAKSPPTSAALSMLADVESQAAVIELRRAESERLGVELRLSHVQSRFGLDRFDTDVLLLALAPEVDARYGRLFGYLHDDVSRARCTVDIALALLPPSLGARMDARRRFTHEAPLVRHGLIKLHADPHDREATLIRSSIKVDSRIVDYLHGIDEPDPAISDLARLVGAGGSLSALLLDGELRDKLARVARLPAAARRVVYLQGPRGAGKKSIAAAMCAVRGRRALVVDARRLERAPEEKVLEVARLAAREARLNDAALYWDGFDISSAADRRAVQLGAAIMRETAKLPGLTFFAGEAPWDPEIGLSETPVLRVEIGVPSRPDQVRFWAAALREARVVEEVRAEDLTLLAGRYRLTFGQIREAVATARDMAQLHDPELGELTHEHLASACRIHGAPRLSSLARKITVKGGWDDLVLPKDKHARLREICNHARYRSLVLDTWGFASKLAGGKGLSLLFSGPPGTGKTMAAGVMANELGQDLFAIDLSNVVNKYIGETEKHLAKIFDEAERSSAVLFFDEADALFGKRSEVKDAHDRYANIETSYLLQRMEAYEGVAILATNLAQNMDEAFVRRIHFIVDFTVPDERERLRIWERIWPEGTPRDPDIDLALIARRFDLSGGSIRNVALAAAYLAAAEGAPVCQRHLTHATRREYQKMGKFIDERLFQQRGGQGS